ncbi:MAG: MFS transporter [Acidimicrobiales bacterium]
MAISRSAFRSRPRRLDLAAAAPDSSKSPRPGLATRLFGSPQFVKLLVAQIVSATGDWLGLLATIALATRLGSESPGLAVGGALSARVLPGFFFAPVAGVLVDRWDRKKVMVRCDLGRAAVLCFLPFVDSLVGLVLASLLLEAFTLLWQPAKEASVPHLVSQDKLTTANSLSLAAAYGTFPLAAGLFGLLSKVSDWFGNGWFMQALNLHQEGLGFYADAFTFLLSATLVWRLTLPRPRRTSSGAPGKAGAIGPDGRRVADPWAPFRELAEGWQFIAGNSVVKAVILGLGTGLIGGGMLVPLGPLFLHDVLGAGSAGFGLFTFVLGLGVASGVLALTALQRKLQKKAAFTACVFGAGACLFCAASTTTLTPAAVFVGGVGVCAGAVYVLGFTLLHESVDDELRGRIFAALYTLVRLCVLIAFSAGPLVSELLSAVSDRFGGEVSPIGFDIAIPGVRLTMWLAALIILGAGLLSLRILSRGRAAGR